jgi:serine protease Do
MKRFSLVLAGFLLAGAAGTLIGRSGLDPQPPRVAGAPGAPGAAAVPVIPKELSSYRDIVKKVLPAVVSIEAQSVSGKPRRPARPEDMQLPGERPFFGPPPRPTEDAPSRVGFGSGFLVSAKGVVVTNNHVVDGADQVLVQLRDGRKFTSKDIKTDPKTDLAIVRIKSAVPLPFLEFGDSHDMEIGDRVLAVGAPFGLTGTVTHGIISAKGRALRMNLYEDFLQTDAAINPGNSGGPLVNLEGKVIGINSAIKSRTGGFQGIGMAISSNLGKNIMQQLLDKGVVRRGYLGVQIKDIEDEAEAKKYGLTEAKGVRVTRVFEDAPGDKGGLKAGDVIVRIAGKAVRDGRDLQHIVAGLEVGKEAEVRVFRAGRPQVLKITIEEQPRTFGSGAVPPPRLPDRTRGALAVDKIGLDVANLTAELAEALGYPEGTRGALVTKVERGGLAAGVGIRPGMLITAVDRKAVTTAKAVRDQVSGAALDKGVRVRVLAPNGRSAEVLLRDSSEE